MGNGYNVVVHQESGFYTWTTFNSKEEFERKIKEEDFWKNAIIPAKEISDSEASLICQEHNNPLL